MPLDREARRTLVAETLALESRLDRVKPFALLMPALPAAAVSPTAAAAIDRHLAEGRVRLRAMVRKDLAWLRGVGALGSSAERAQRRFSLLKLRFNSELSQFDIFSDALTQRSEAENGVWLSGLDAAADDALRLPGAIDRPPPVVVYLDRGHGAAIRRVRTRLPGGGENPVALIRIPRERMVGSGIASSLVHEVGHQGAELLGLLGSLRSELGAVRRRYRDLEARLAWTLWQRWISEVVSDFWSVAKLGVAATQGLMGVVSLPRVFVFRVSPQDPHPVPWIRVKLNIAAGQALFPDPQWSALDRLWESFYPLESVPTPTRRLLRTLEATLPRFVELLADHRPSSLRGRALRQVFPLPERQPWRLRRRFTAWQRDPRQMRLAPPTLVFAVLGQARQDRRLDPREETRLVARMLDHWALDRTYPSTRPQQTPCACAGPPALSAAA